MQTCSEQDCSDKPATGCSQHFWDFLAHATPGQLVFDLLARCLKGAKYLFCMYSFEAPKEHVPNKPAPTSLHQAVGNMFWIFRHGDLEIATSMFWISRGAASVSWHIRSYPITTNMFAKQKNNHVTRCSSKTKTQSHIDIRAMLQQPSLCFIAHGQRTGESLCAAMICYVRQP